MLWKSLRLSEPSDPSKQHDSEQLVLKYFRPGRSKWDLSGQSIPLDDFVLKISYQDRRVELASTVLPDAFRRFSERAAAMSVTDNHDKHTGSPESMDFALAWIKECQENHPECSQEKNSSASLPTRVLDVGTRGACRLQTETLGLLGPYVTLSYCWGSGRRIFTTLSNIHTRQQNIEIKELPATIRDAIQVTHDLGYRWLWIDQLCIIQDSPEDVQRELAVMDEIYTNAALTLAASKGDSVDDGLFVERDPRWFRPCRVTIKNIGKGADSSNDYVFLRPNCVESPDPGESASARTSWYGSNDFDGHNLNSLGRRGWTLQEAVLSTRMLVFGPVRLEWFCLRGWASEDHPISKVGLPYIFNSKHKIQRLRTWISPNFLGGLCNGEISEYDNRISDVTSLSRHNTSFIEERFNEMRYPAWDSFQQNLYNDWYAIVTNYSGRALAFEQDKLPALAGVAKRMYMICKTNYLAGLWKDDLVFGLLWHVEPTRDRASLRKPACYLGPSWSWVSRIDRQVGFVDYASRPRYEQTFGMTVIESRCVLATPNKFGSVKDGHLLLSSVMKHAKARVVAEYFEIKGFEGIGHRNWRGAIKDDDSGETIGGVYFDEDVQALEQVEFDFFLIYFEDADHGSNWNKRRYVFRGLALIRKNNSDDYQRIGLATIVKQDWFGDISVDNDRKYRTQVRIV
ncbi:uncharacterized protein BP5553_05670 [Venustampulla echinocandica]|uniref:Heterokaryon incompatibility domain-containing protein n=1 Tax=Venustampulla echinocandica TaxID=2656787 RepID=A0A370TLA9_9HELO|nr:uncharacterized protein BP5553_05670 [Venustampulla echinocandica]RDL36318.1 hypothetical protein BP5553_05670 [Venustampulla echinocandica]